MAARNLLNAEDKELDICTLCSACTSSLTEVNKHLIKYFDEKMRVERELNAALENHRRLIDASPADNIIAEHHIFQDSVICAPGVPHGLSPRALGKISHRFIHDPLQIGVATMIVDAVR